MAQVTIEQAAQRAGVSTQTIRRWIASGKYPAVKIEGRWRIDTAEHPELDPPPEPAPSAELQPMLTSLTDLANRLADEAAARAVAETRAAFLEERLAELRAKYEPAEPLKQDAEVTRRRWWRRS